MSLGNPLPIVLADMRRSRAGIAAVIALIAVAVAVGVAVSAQERALRKGSARAADAFDLLVGAPGSETQLVLSTVYLQPGSVNLVDGRVLRELAATEGVVYAAPVGFGDSFRGHPIVGSIAALVTRGGAQPLADGRVFEHLFEAVIGAQVDLAIGDELMPTHGRIALEEDEHGHGTPYRVAGRMRPSGTPWDRAIVVPIESIWRVHAMPTGHPDLRDETRLGPPWDGDVVPGVPAIVVKPVSVRDAYVLRSRYRGDDTMALFPAEVLIKLYSLLGDARAVVAAIAVATQVLVIGAVLLAVFAALALRRKQLALLRALGASRGFVFSVIWAHVVIMITLGACLGLGLGWLGAMAVSQSLAASTGVALSVSVTGKELAMVLSLVGIGLVLALIPGVAAYRQSVSAGLRG